MSAYHLKVFCAGMHAADLEHDPATGEFAFQYTRDWREHEQGFSLAPSLPLLGGISSSSVRRFLENLLPEGRALDVASVHWNIQKSNVFGLIRQLGRETAGALTFLPAGDDDISAAQPTAREISHEELQQRIAQRNEIPFSVWDGKVRMSVAGFQDKLLVQKHADRLFLVDGSLASTHILKPQPLNTQLAHMVANEHFCMRLAQEVGLRAYKTRSLVAEVEILRVPDPVLCIRRFDRLQSRADLIQVPGAGALPQVHRLHIIDGCQALDVPPSMKYERNIGNGPDVRHIRDGISLPRLLPVAGLLEQPALGIRRLNFWAVLTLLLGNSDAHGKNISFMVAPSGMKVAPLYDLVGVTAYGAGQIEHDLAMAFGNEFGIQDVTPFALADHCVRCGIDRKFFARELKVLCALAVQVTQDLSADPVYTPDERAFIHDLAKAVRERASLLSAMAVHISRFKDSDLI
jgi:serine/threonine-protein kinase HipA